MTRYTVSIEHDEDTESPAEYDCQWKLYSFSRKHSSFRDPSDFFDGRTPKLWLRNKLRVGLAFVVSYYEHSQCVWSLRGDGPQCQWDNVDVAGILVWEHKPSDIGAKTFEDRAKDAALFLETYTDWCNGACYYYSIEKTEADEEDDDADMEDVDSCGGFIGEEHLAESIANVIPDDANEDNTEITGDCAWIAEYHDIFKTEAPVAGDATA